MIFWQFWEVAFQAFMILIGVGIIWLKFIEPLFPSRQVSVTLMIIVAVALAAAKNSLGCADNPETAQSRASSNRRHKRESIGGEMIELRNISKIYGQDTIAVRNLNLTIQDHEFFVIYGPAGAGKTTTLRLIGGISQPSQGDILRDGVSILNVAPENRNMAMAFENYALYSHMSVYENLAFPLKSGKLSKQEIDDRVRQSSPDSADHRAAR